MSLAEGLGAPAAKRRVLYGAMLLVGAVFVATLALPVDAATRQLLAVLTFGVMSGLWLGHLVHSL